MSSSKKSDPAQTLWEMTGYCPGQIHLQGATGHRPGLSHQQPPSSPQTNGHNLCSVRGEMHRSACPGSGWGAPKETSCEIGKTHTEYPLWFQRNATYRSPTSHSLHGLQVGGHQGKHRENLSLSQCNLRPPALILSPPMSFYTF